MFRYQGHIDFSALGPPPKGLPRVESNGDSRAVRLPGLELRWSARSVDVAARDGVMALATGNTRGRDRSQTGEAQFWIERYVERGEHAAVDIGGGFAVAILDFANRRALLFVDRFSIETLCY